MSFRMCLPNNQNPKMRLTRSRKVEGQTPCPSIYSLHNTPPPKLEPHFFTGQSLHNRKTPFILNPVSRKPKSSNRDGNKFKRTRTRARTPTHHPNPGSQTRPSIIHAPKNLGLPETPLQVLRPALLRLLHLPSPPDPHRRQRKSLQARHSLRRPVPPRRTGPPDDPGAQVEVPRRPAEPNPNQGPGPGRLPGRDPAAEARARECYSEAIRFGPDEYLEMLVLDGCFIVELFRKIGKVVPIEHDDPLISMWVYSFILRDFIRLENQIPFFVLQRLFDLSLMPGEESGPSLAKLALVFFNNALQRPEEVITRHASTPGRHLLDFLRSSFIPTDHEPTKQGNQSQNHVIQCISKLRRAGIDLRPGDEDSFLVVKFRRGVIEMPAVSIDNFMSCLMINCIAFEQCQARCTRHFTTYATLLDCLVNTGKDIEFLSDRNIVENYFGTDAELAKFINDLGKDVTFDIENSYLGNLFYEVNRYYQSGWHVQWASFRYTYFRSPWSFISALAAFVLLVLSVAQTFYTMLAYIHPANPR